MPLELAAKRAPDNAANHFQHLLLRLLLIRTVDLRLPGLFEFERKCHLGTSMSELCCAPEQRDLLPDRVRPDLALLIMVARLTIESGLPSLVPILNISMADALSLRSDQYIQPRLSYAAG